MNALRLKLRDLLRYLLKLAVALPWELLTFVMRLLYGFHVQNLENLPKTGPYVLMISEFSLIAMICSGWVTIKLLKNLLINHPEKVISYMQEDLFAFSYFRAASRLAGGSMRPLLPHTGGRLTLNLLDGYRVLSNGGYVVINPQGDMPWDGRPLPIQSGAAWLGLHTAAPLVPIICTSGAYDVWPRWQLRPSLSGKFVMRVGQPFKLSEAPLEKITDEDLSAANARILAEFNRLQYGAEGSERWTSAAVQHGVSVAEDIPVRLLPPAVDAAQWKHKPRYVPLLRRGLAQVLWRCPVCSTHDALFHSKRLLRKPHLRCHACGTLWVIRRVPGKDFSLQVAEGPAEIRGLEMALTHWYDRMKRDFQATPILVPGLDLRPGEEAHLSVDEAALMPYRPNSLFEEWIAGEAPSKPLAGRRELAQWESIGTGRLVLTNQRLVWQGEQGDLSFEWPVVTAVYVWLQNSLGIRYGTARYRFSLGSEVGLKWLTHAGEAAQHYARQNGAKVTVSTY